MTDNMRPHRPRAGPRPHRPPLGRVDRCQGKPRLLRVGRCGRHLGRRPARDLHLGLRHRRVRAGRPRARPHPHAHPPELTARHHLPQHTAAGPRARRDLPAHLSPIHVSSDRSSPSPIPRPPVYATTQASRFPPGESYSRHPPAGAPTDARGTHVNKPPIFRGDSFLPPYHLSGPNSPHTLSNPYQPEPDLPWASARLLVRVHHPAPLSTTHR